MRCALYFGSFNPLHIGHAAIAKYVLQNCNVDSLRLVLTPVNPFKVHDPSLANVNTRLAALQKSVERFNSELAREAEIERGQEQMLCATNEANIESGQEQTPDAASKTDIESGIAQGAERSNSESAQLAEKLKSPEQFNSELAKESIVERGQEQMPDAASKTDIENGPEQMPDAANKTDIERGIAQGAERSNSGIAQEAERSNNGIAQEAERSNNGIAQEAESFNSESAQLAEKLKSPELFNNELAKESIVENGPEQTPDAASKTDIENGQEQMPDAANKTDIERGPEQTLCATNEAEIENGQRGSCKKLEISTVEFDLPQPNYTYNTLQHLKQAEPHNTFIIVMGADNLAAIERWHRGLEILQQYEVWVYPRQGFDTEALCRKYGATYLDAPLMNVSSTMIREGLAQGLDMSHLMY